MRSGVLVVLALLAGGCVTRHPHNDVAIFGTTTKVAIDVDAPVQNGGIPQFTIGYKRNEGVWMPLKPNGVAHEPGDTVADLIMRLNDCVQTAGVNGLDTDTANRACLAEVLPRDKYVSYATGVDASKGGNGGELDTYSVFASFGGGGGIGFNSANGHLAQFFATGIAAQRLGANPNVGLALNAKSGDAIAEQAGAEAKKAEAAEKEASTVAAQYKALKDAGASEEDALELIKGNEAAREQLAKDTAAAVACVRSWNGNPPNSLANENAKAIVGGNFDDEALVEEIIEDDGARRAILDACK